MVLNNMCKFQLFLVSSSESFSPCQCKTLGSKKQAIFRKILLITSIFRMLYIHVHDLLSKRNEIYCIVSKKTMMNQKLTNLPSPSPPQVSQNRKRGVDASFSFNFGLYRLMRRLSFTFRKKSFLKLSLPITSKSDNSP